MTRISINPLSDHTLTIEPGDSDRNFSIWFDGVCLGTFIPKEEPDSRPDDPEFIEEVYTFFDTFLEV